MNVDRLRARLPRLDYPVQTGTHGNTALALLALDDTGAATRPAPSDG